MTSLGENPVTIGSRAGWLLCSICVCAVFSGFFSEVGVQALSATNVDSELFRLLPPADVEFLGPLSTLTLSHLPFEGRPVRKILVLFVGLVDPDVVGAGIFWDPSPSCTFCQGLPENRKIVIDALSRGYAVIVPTSIHEGALGWSEGAWPPESPDLNNVASVISEWKVARGLENVPVVGVGFSAGGDGILSLALRPGFFESMVVMISGGREETRQVITSDYPPTLFVHMPKDEQTEAAISQLLSVLRSKGIKVDDTEWHEQPLSPEWFAELIPGLSRSTSAAIFSAFKEEQFLDENNFFYAYTAGSHACSWQAALRARNVLDEESSGNGKLKFEDSIAQEMNVAFAKHATLSRKDDDVFAWFEGGFDHILTATS